MSLTPSRPSDHLRAPLWLAHHRPGQLDRCVRVGNTAVCRRCAVLYPCVVVCWITLVWLNPSATTLVLAGWILPLPMVADWVLEHLGRAHHSPARLIAVTLLAAPGLGALLALHSREAMDLRALAPAAVYGTVAMVAAWSGSRSRAGEDWQGQHLADEARRAQRLTSLLDLDAHEVHTTRGGLQSRD